jgi:non-ribosomal peptide synthase protein (TIGR01720 family)
VVLESREGEEIGDLIRGVKEGLRQVPDKGLGYGVLKYINKIQELREAEPWEIVFNYLGQISAVMKRSELFGSCGESAGRNMSDGQTLTEKLTVNCWISEGELRVQWVYSGQHHRRETMEELGACYIRDLEALTGHCAGLQKQVNSPSDFGLGREVGYRELDSFLNKEGTKKTNIMEF